VRERERAVCVCVCVQSDANKRDKKKVEIYQLMMDLLKAEEQCAWSVRRSESEVQDILDDRLREELATELAERIHLRHTEKRPGQETPTDARLYTARSLARVTYYTSAMRVATAFRQCRSPGLDLGLGLDNHQTNGQL